jgi:hypothetical protein
MKKLIIKIKCWLGYHVEGYPHGIVNSYTNYKIRIHFFACSECGKTIHSIEDTSSE